MANPLEAGFSEDHRGKIRKPPRESVIRNIISPAIEEDRAHGSFQDYLDINKAHVLMLARQGIISEEVEKAIACGFRPISLGKSRLRTETAALAACHILNITNQIE